MTATAAYGAVAETTGLKTKDVEGSRRGHRGGCCRRIEKEWLFQARRSAQHEAEEEASNTSQERRKPIHQGTMRVQSQARFQDRQGIANEEVQGDDQLGPFCSE